MSATHKLTEHGAPWILLQVATQLHKGTTKGSFSAQWCKKVVFQSPHNVPRDRSNRVCWILPRRMGILTMLLIPTKTNTNEQKTHNNLVVDYRLKFKMQGDLQYTKTLVVQFPETWLLTWTPVWVLGDLLNTWVLVIRPGIHLRIPRNPSTLIQNLSSHWQCIEALQHQQLAKPSHRHEESSAHRRVRLHGFLVKIRDPNGPNQTNKQKPTGSVSTLGYA